MRPIVDWCPREINKMTSMRMDHFDKQLREDRLAHLPPAMLPRQPPPLDQNGKMVVSRARVSVGLVRC